ncbi:MAG: hypothetical protein RIE83_19445 [Thalassobaculaceae bacterium]
MAGTADLLIPARGGVAYFVEVKLEADKLGSIRRTIPSDKQVEFEKKVAGLGFAYHVVRNMDQWLNVLPGPRQIIT